MKNQVILMFALCILFMACAPKNYPTGTDGQNNTSGTNGANENNGQTAEETNLPNSQTLLKADDKVIEGTMQR